MSLPANKIERPRIISVICILGFIGVVLSGYWILKAQPGDYERGDLLLTGGSSLIGLIGLIGIWRMKKWGANLYTVIAVVNIAYLFFTDKEFLSSLIISAIVIFILLSNYSKMK